MQALPFDPALGPAIPLPKNFAIESQTADEIVIIGQRPDTADVRNYHIRITFYITNEGYISRKCFKQEKYEQFRQWMTQPDWCKNGNGSKCCSDWVLRALLNGVYS